VSAGRGPRRAGEDRALELALLDDLYAHWARGEFFATQELYDPALEFVFSDDFPEAGVHQGIEGMGAAFVAWLRAWELWRARAPTSPASRPTGGSWSWPPSTGGGRGARRTS
jgi:hypothetical protein